MSRAFTYWGIASFTLAAALAACSGGSSADSDGDSDGSTDGTGGGTLDPGVDGGDGGNDPRIVERTTPVGFTNYDDGTGNSSYKSPGITAEQAAALTGALASPPAADPTLLFDYPFADTMVPGNLTFIEFQWRRATNQEAFLLRVQGTETFHLYIDAECTKSGYCSRILPMAEWLTMGKRLAGQTVDIEVFGYDGTSVTKSEPLELEFSPEALVGALYYWAASNKTIKRVSFGSESAVDFIVPKSDTSDYECVACHSVSRDGNVIAFAVGPDEGENIAGIQTASTTDPTMKYIVPTNGTTPFSSAVSHGKTEGPTNSLGHNVALNPDGSLMAVNATDPPDNWPSHLDIRATDAPDSLKSRYDFGDPIFGGEKIGIQPEFSPDGTQLAVMLAEKNGDAGLSAWSAQKGGIATIPVNVAAGTLGNAKVIVTAPTDGSYHFYPTWSPDSAYIAFVTSWDVNGASGSLGNDHGVLRMVAVADAPVTCPGPKCIELGRGTGYGVDAAQAMSGTSASTWPKFAPFEQGDGVYFITFTSRRQYGARPLSNTQLWMFGIDTKVAGDPSFSPFWLPYQTESDGSLSPYWTKTLPCNTEGGVCNGCLSSEQCAVNTDDNSCTCEAIPKPK